jgi:phasin family protein
MNDTIEKTAEVQGERVQTLFADGDKRIQDAMQKSATFGTGMTEFSKGNAEAMLASIRVAATGAESMSREAGENAKKHFDSAAALFKSFCTVKSPTELFQLQSDYARASFDTAVSEVSTFRETFVKLASDAAQPLSDRFTGAAEKINASAK